MWAGGVGFDDEESLLVNSMLLPGLIQRKYIVLTIVIASPVYAEGLSHYLLYLSKVLKRSKIVLPDGVTQISAYIKAMPYQLQLLFELNEGASDRMGGGGK